MSSPHKASAEEPPTKKLKHTKGPHPNIVYDFKDLAVGNLFDEAIAITQAIVLSAQFYNVLKGLILEEGESSQFHEEIFTKTLEEDFYLLPNLQRRNMGAYAWTNPAENNIYVNAQMLMSYAFEGDRDAKVVFLVVKLVHELSHIFNYRCCSLFHEVSKGKLLLTPEKVLKQRFFKVTRMGRKEQIAEVDEEVKYNNFGELMELMLFGGLVECASDAHEGDYLSFMKTDFLVSYPSIATLYGHEINSRETLSAFKSGNYPLILGDPYKSKSQPAIRGVPVNISCSRLAAPGAGGGYVEEEDSEFSGHSEDCKW